MMRWFRFVNLGSMSLSTWPPGGAEVLGLWELWQSFLAKFFQMCQLSPFIVLTVLDTTRLSRLKHIMGSKFMNYIMLMHNTIISATCIASIYMAYVT